jgi:alkylhydroperoxidase/carboxymuconolactone decarboxylase family protein YurZ
MFTLEEHWTTKELIHFARVLALHCEPRAVSHFTGAKGTSATEQELDEVTQLAGSVGAGVILAIADRAREPSDQHKYWWRQSKHGQ